MGPGEEKIRVESGEPKFLTQNDTPPLPPPCVCPESLKRGRPSVVQDFGTCDIGFIFAARADCREFQVFRIVLEPESVWERRRVERICRVHVLWFLPKLQNPVARWHPRARS